MQKIYLNINVNTVIIILQDFQVYHAIGKYVLKIKKFNYELEIHQKDIVHVKV